MTDEFVTRYQGWSHQELYNAVQAGDPDQLDGVVKGWKVLEDTTRALADDLAADLAKLSAGWGGQAGQEYQRRVGLVSDFAGVLSDEQSMVKLEISTLSGVLREAKAKAESPASVDDNDKAISGAGKGALAGAILGPAALLAGTVTGAIFGHEQDEQEKANAHQRMVQVVASLAVEYDIQSNTIVPPLIPPLDLPGEDPSGGVDPTGPGGVTAPRGMPRTGPGVGASTADLTAPAPVVPISDPGLSDGTSALLGVDGSTLAGVTASSAAGAGALIVGGAAFGAPGPAGAGLTTGMPAGGVLASGPVGGANLTSSSPGAFGRSSGVGPAGSSSLTSTSTTGTGAGRGAGLLGRGGQAPEDEADGHDSWLIEDDMVWGDDENIPPSVLGGQPISE